MNYTPFIEAALQEDLGNGDFSTLASIDKNAKGKAVLKIKDEGILAGMDVAEAIFKHLEPSCTIIRKMKDGDKIQQGDIAFEMEASAHTILSGERLTLNCMQRMSGIATLTHQFVQKIQHTNAKVLDTRKTTPGFRMLEKAAVKIGGGENHRFGLYDMIMLKDNHIDFCGGIAQAILKTKSYLEANNLSLKIEVETRSINDIKIVMETGYVDRIMLDNFSPEMMQEGIDLINGQYETEASGGINLDNILTYAETGVDYISIGALTHQAQSLDLSLKAVIQS